MQLKDLPEEIQMQVLSFSNKIIRSLEGQPVELIDLIDKAVVAGMELEAKRHNNTSENLAQTLVALRNFCATQFIQTPQLLNILGLVDQCLVENKPLTIIP